MPFGERRFSVYTLEEGEVLLWDTVAEYQRLGSQKQTDFEPLKGTGRLKVATHAVYFDFDDWSLPVVKLLFKDIDFLKGTGFNKGVNAESADFVETGSPNSNVPFLRDSDTVNSIFLQSDTVTLLKEEGYDHPHVRETVRFFHVIHSPYSNLEVVYSLCCELVTANKLDREERYTHLQEIIASRRNVTPFDITWLEYGLVERTYFDEPCFLVYPLSEDHGRVLLTNYNVYFMPIHSGGFDSSPVERHPSSSIHCVRTLEYRSLPLALEVWFSDLGPIWMLVFENQKTRDVVLKSLMECTAAKEPKCSLVYLSVSSNLDYLLDLWQKRKISNYDYLLALNFFSGRTFLDISQYPVFPWVLSDYTSENIDLDDPRSFRRLDCSIGALNLERLNTLIQRCNDMPSPKFLYGSHYSSPSSVIHFLVRSAPFLMLKLQNGRYDQPDRLFRDISETWINVNTLVNNFNELIPEFFAVDENELPRNSLTKLTNRFWYPGNFLVNELGIDFGTCQDGRKVDNVDLPPWAKGRASEFIKMNRNALESNYVDRHLHLWIDLVFGYKSRSLQDHNLFFTDVFGSQRPDIAAEFGQTPKRIFSVPHPPRTVDSNGLAESRCSLGETFNLYEFTRTSAENSYIIDATVTSQMIFTIWSDGSFLSHALESEDAAKHYRRLSLSSSSVDERLRNCKFTVVRETSTDCVILGTDTGSLLFYSVSLCTLSNICVEAHQGELCSILFDQKSNTVISSSKDGSIRCWACEKESGPLSNCVLSGPGRLVYDLDAEDIVHDIAVEQDPIDSQTMLAAIVDNIYLLLWKLDLSCRHSDDPVLRPLLKISVESPSLPRSLNTFKQSLCFCEPLASTENITGLVWRASDWIVQFDSVDKVYRCPWRRAEWRNRVVYLLRVDKCHILFLEFDGQLSLVRVVDSHGKVETVATSSIGDIDTSQVNKIGCYVPERADCSVVAYIVLRTGKILGCKLSF